MTQWKYADPEQVRLSADLLGVLEQAGHIACWVGGCVRDELIGRPVNDMDIATSARPEEVIGLFARTVPTGIQHGTVTVILDKMPFEVTTFRTESAYQDFRRPDEVTFVRSLDEDLRRRDFTMNAIARLPGGDYIDPYGGLADLERGLIRCVGEARERFREDALRMLRGVRFASVFGFELAPSTWEALLELRGNMRHIAAERIRAELEKMIGGPQPSAGLRLLARSGLLEDARMGLQPQALRAAAPERLDDLPPKPGELRWAALLQGLGVSGEEAESRLKSWTFSGGFAKSAAALLRIDEAMNAAGLFEGAAEAGGFALRREQLAAREESAAGPERPGEQRAGAEPPAPQEREAGAPPHQPREADARTVFVRCVLDFGRTAAETWLAYRSALHGADEGRSARLERAASWLAAIPAESPRELALGGHDLAGQLNRAPGPWLGALIRRLLEVVALGEIANEREALLAEALRLEARLAKNETQAQKEERPT